MNNIVSKLAVPVTAFIAICMFLYHMVSTQYLFFGSYEHQNIHLGFLLILGFLSTMIRLKNKYGWILQLFFVCLTVIVTLYIFFNIQHLEEVIGMPEPLDVLIGIILIVLVIEATRQAWGMTLPIVTGIFIGYFFLGHLIPGALNHQPFSFDFIISRLSIGLSGIFGTFLSISANQVFLFVVFGALLELVKLNDFFFECGKIAGRYLDGGPGHTAVISSSMVGMVSGASVANVAITGSFTIPYMRRVGYTPEMAAAIEATASTGGQIMPPIMGASAFLMAFFLGIPYFDVMLAAILPALLFYMGIALGVQFIAAPQGIGFKKESFDLKLILRRLPLFFVPLTVIVVMLFLRYSPMRAAFWAIITIVIMSLIYKEVRPTFSVVVKCITKGSMVGAKVGLSLAIVGMMAQTLITTDLGTKFAGLVQTMSGGNLFIALFATMIISIILGCGIPTTAAYSLVALVVAPTLIRLGVLPISAHFFCFYFAIISAVTPPVALCSLAASGIANSNYWKTSIAAFKLAISGFIIPFLIIYNPVLNLKFSNILIDIISLVSIVIGLIAFTSFIYNYGLTKFTMRERLISLTIALTMLGYSIFQTTYPSFNAHFMLILGAILTLFLLVGQVRNKRNVQTGKVVSAT